MQPNGSAFINHNLAFVDIETTGTSILRDRIIEIGILRVENGKLVSTFNSLINPQTHLPPSIENMTGIKSCQLENAPTFYSLKREILKILTGCLFVAHNSRFDYAFIKNEFKRFDISFSAKNLCTVKLSRYLFPRYKRHNLDNIIARFNILCKNRHRAFDDANVLWDFINIIQTQFDKEKLTKAFNFVTKKTTAPINIKPDILDSLPETSGIYIFYGKNGVPLYIGKSVNIKERVLSHFANDHSSPVEMKISQQIESIETIQTAGELGALLKESLLIKKLQPLYNRKLRIKKNLIILKRVTDKTGYETVASSAVNEIKVDDLSDILGVFKSKKQMIDFLKFNAKEYNLCEKILGIEKTNRACFGYHLDICKGACTGQEKPIKYNIRFIEAFTRNKIKPWPFKGPIIIKESDGFEKEESFLVDKWCILGSYCSDTDIIDKQISENYSFNQDTYKILNQFLFTNKNRKKIKNLSVLISKRVDKNFRSF